MRNRIPLALLAERQVYVIILNGERAAADLQLRAEQRDPERMLPERRVPLPAEAEEAVRVRGIMLVSHAQGDVFEERQPPDALVKRLDRNLSVRRIVDDRAVLERRVWVRWYE